MMNLHKFAEQIRQTEFQENDWLRAEIADLRRLTWMLVESVGGEIRIPDTVELMAKDDCRIAIHEDADNRYTVVRSEPFTPPL